MPPNPNKDGAKNAAILPICRTPQNEYYAILGVQKRSQASFLDTFGGHLDESETAEAGALRELKEESIDVFKDLISEADLNNPKKTKQFLAHENDKFTRVFVTVFDHKNPRQLVERFHTLRHSKLPLTPAQKEITAIRMVDVNELCNYVANPSNAGLMTLDREVKRTNDKVVTELSMRRCAFKKLHLHHEDLMDFFHEMGVVKVVYAVNKPVPAEMKQQTHLTGPLWQIKSTKDNTIKLYFEFEQEAARYLDFIRSMLPGFQSELANAKIRKSRLHGIQSFRFRLTEQQYKTFNQQVYVIKTVRADETGYFRHFSKSITRDLEGKQINKPMMRNPKSRFTVMGEGVFNRATKLPRFTPLQKRGRSYLQPVSVIMPGFQTPLYGDNNPKHAGKLVRVRIPFTEVLMGRLFIKDAGTRGRGYDHPTYQQASNYHQNKTKGDHPQLFADMIKYRDAFIEHIKTVTKPVNNEGLARLRWNNENCSVRISSNTLEARLIAQDYARILWNDLRTIDKPLKEAFNKAQLDERKKTPKDDKTQQETKDIPPPITIKFHIPDDKQLHDTVYDEKQQHVDKAEALAISKDPVRFKQKVEDKNFEFLLGLKNTRDALQIQFKGKSVLQIILEYEYFHIAQSVIELEGDHGRMIKLQFEDPNTVLLKAVKYSSFQFVDWLLGALKEFIAIQVKPEIKQVHPLPLRIIKAHRTYQDGFEYLHSQVCAMLCDEKEYAKENNFYQFRDLIEGYLNRLSEGLNSNLPASEIFKLLKTHHQGCLFGNLITGFNHEFFILQFISWLGRFVQTSPHELLALLQAKDWQGKNLSQSIAEFHPDNDFVKEQFIKLLENLLLVTHELKPIMVLFATLEVSLEKYPVLLQAILSFLNQVVLTSKDSDLIKSTLQSKEYAGLAVRVILQEDDGAVILFVKLLRNMLAKKSPVTFVCQLLTAPATSKGIKAQPDKAFTDFLLQHHSSSAVLTEYFSLLTLLKGVAFSFITKNLVRAVIKSENLALFISLLTFIQSGSPNPFDNVHTVVCSSLTETKSQTPDPSIAYSYLKLLSQGIEKLPIATVMDLFNSKLANGFTFCQVLIMMNSEALLLQLINFLKLAIKKDKQKVCQLLIAPTMAKESKAQTGEAFTDCLLQYHASSAVLTEYFSLLALLEDVAFSFITKNLVQAVIKNENLVLQLMSFLKLAVKKDKQKVCQLLIAPTTTKESKAQPGESFTESLLQHHASSAVLTEYLSLLTLLEGVAFSFITRNLIRVVIKSENLALFTTLLTCLQTGAQNPLHNIHAEVCSSLTEAKSSDLSIASSYLKLLSQGIEKLPIATVMDLFNSKLANGFTFCHSLIMTNSETLLLQLINFLQLAAPKEKQKVSDFVAKQLRYLFESHKPSDELINQYFRLLRMLSPHCSGGLHSQIVFRVLISHQHARLESFQDLLFETAADQVPALLSLLKTIHSGCSYPHLLILYAQDQQLLKKYSQWISTLESKGVFVEPALKLPESNKSNLVQVLERLENKAEQRRFAINALNPHHPLGKIFWASQSSFDFVSRLRPRPTSGNLKRVCDVLEALEPDLSIKTAIKIIEEEKLSDVHREAFAWMKDKIKDYILRQPEPLKGQLIERSLDPNKALGKILWAPRLLTEPSLEKGTLGELAREQYSHLLL